MWKIFKKYFSVKYNNLPFLKRSFNSSKNESSFPWRQNLHDDEKSSPFLHKVMGFFIMKKILKNVNAPFNQQEFLEGAELAIDAVSSAISNESIPRLEEIMSVQLSQCFKNAFMSLSEQHQYINLQLEKTRVVNISGVKSIFGKADPSDKHILKVCGQEIIGSRKKLQTVIEESDSPWNDSKDIGTEAAKLGATFQVDVKFKTKERFSICSRDTARVIAGSGEIQSCYHTLKFETYINWLTWDKESNQSYPISWQISDIDRYLERNYPEDNSYDNLI